MVTALTAVRVHVSGFSPLDILGYHKNGSEGSMACNKKKDRRE